MSDIQQEQQALVTFFYHSGFSVAVRDKLLIFDYWEGENNDLPESARLTEADFEPYSDVIFFVSHIHPDHCDEKIYAFPKSEHIHYIASSDMPIGKRGRRLAPGESLTVAGVNVRAYDSTDLGVSYWADVYGISVFHAGDLNFWHWRDEYTLRQISEAEKLYYAAVAPLDGTKPDIAMFPVDPRMGSYYAAGATHFIMSVKPRVFFPMHWWDRPEAALEFARQERDQYTEIVPLTKPRECADLTFTPNQRPNIHLFNAKDNPPVAAQIPLPPEDDPFRDTDLPVDIQ